MVFSSPLFLFAFLPLTLFLYFISPKRLKNITLLLLSLLFYSWGEVFYILNMIFVIFSNYLLGLLISRPSRKPYLFLKFKFIPKPLKRLSLGSKEKCSENDHGKTFFLLLGVFINIALLSFFKYANFIVVNINVLLTYFNLSPFIIEPVHLPIGISFYTFQAISYLMDVYRKETPAQKNLIDLALYISLFPQLIAGPIVRYHDISHQITRRIFSIEMVATGVQRFIFGLSKKVLVADTMGKVTDQIFLLPAETLSMSVSWLGILCFSLQIYFDFSGYSDMAIGIGRMFGFTFLENFNYPYISKSLREFWKRWHISLSTWFRDYLYIPMGGSRVSKPRVYMNLFIVFLLCGLWHGANWTFIVWGLIHGFFLIVERIGLSDLLKKTWYPLRHLYTLLVVTTAWVFFRSDNISFALNYISTMFGYIQPLGSYYTVRMFINTETLVALVLGTLFSFPLYRFLSNKIRSFSCDHNNRKFIYIYIPKLSLVSILLFASIMKVSASTINPFIYFRF